MYKEHKKEGEGNLHYARPWKFKKTILAKERKFSLVVFL
jgi:hypothetical protein